MKRDWKTEKEKDRRLRKRYGITLEQFNSMLQAQKDCCAVCKIPFEHRRRNVDHAHDHTKRVRGILCYQCNSLRVAGNTLKTALKVVDYLKREKALGL